MRDLDGHDEAGRGAPHRAADLSGREREIMDSLYRRERATVADVREDLVDAPTASAVRTMLARLEEKGHVRHAREGLRNVYRPTVPRDAARDSALQRVLDTFFESSPTRAMAAILDRSARHMSDEELDRLQQAIEAARKRGR